MNVCDAETKVTPLHQAATLGRLDSMGSLLKAGAKVDAQNKQGLTALHISSLRGQAAAVKLLLDGSNSDASCAIHMTDSQGATALHKAAYRGSAECIQLLTDRGSDLGAKTVTGVTALTLILQLPIGPKLLGQRFDACVSTNGVDASEFSCRLKFDYSMLIGRSNRQQMSLVENILDEPQERRTAELLQHPLIESFVFLKWQKIRRLFLSTVLAYLILVVGITTV